MGHPCLTFWEFSPFGGVGISKVNLRLANRKCAACGKNIIEKSYQGASLHMAGPGARWPDILNCGDLPIVHERVAARIAEVGLTGAVAHPTTIAEVGVKGLRNKPIPAYFLLEIRGKVDVDHSELGGAGNFCTFCGQSLKLINAGGGKGARTIPKLETWDGSDFVMTRNWKTTRFYCTRRFVDLACENHWTNFRFGTGHSMPGAGMWGDAAKSGGVS